MILKKEIEDYLYYCRYQKMLNSKTVHAYKVDLSQLTDFLELHENKLNKDVLKAYVVYLHKNFRPKSVKRKIASLKALFNYLEMEEIIRDNPMHSVKTRFQEESILPKTISRDKIETLLNYLYNLKNQKIESEWRNKLVIRDIAIVEMLFATGLRISELCNLKDCMLDLEEGVLCIKGKGNKERYLQIGNTEALESLKQYKVLFNTNITKSDFFFVNRYGEKLSEQSARRMIHKHTEEAKIDTNITPHMFRHAFATLLLEEEVDIRYIQKMLGHASITTTQIYTYVTSKKQKEILMTKHPRNKMMINI